MIQQGGRSKLDETTTFDALARKQTVINTADKTITSTYDAIRLRAQMTNPAAAVTTCNYNANAEIDHLVNPDDESTSYSYDTAGRPMTKKLAVGTRALQRRRGQLRS